MKHEGDDYSNRDWCFRYSNKRIIKRTGGLINWRTSGDHPNYSITENGQNTEKSPRDLRRISVSQTLVKNHQGVNNADVKTSQGGSNNDNNNETKQRCTDRLG